MDKTNTYILLWAFQCFDEAIENSCLSEAEVYLRGIEIISAKGARYITKNILDKITLSHDRVVALRSLTSKISLDIGNIESAKS